MGKPSPTYIGFCSTGNRKAGSTTKSPSLSFSPGKQPGFIRAFEKEKFELMSFHVPLSVAGKANINSFKRNSGNRAPETKFCTNIPACWWRACQQVHVHQHYGRAILLPLCTLEKPEVVAVQCHSGPECNIYLSRPWSLFLKRK